MLLNYKFYYYNCLLILLCTMFSLQNVSAQGALGCDGQRYTDKVFSNVSTQLEVQFGNAVQPTLFNPNATMDLGVDIYQPVNDNLAKRPLIIWAFGGAFVAGSSLSPDIVTLCNEFAERGYVTASIDYRLSLDLIFDNSEENAYEAVMLAMHDLKAAIRFFYKDAATTNTYRIDTSRIFIGGVSAGALAALHVAYLDEISEVPGPIYNEFINNGGLEGNSGNPGYSSEVAGVINLSGALVDTSMMKACDEPVVSMHGTEDGTVPYDTDLITLLNINLEVDGSYSVDIRADNLGIYNDFYTWSGAGHTPFVSNSAYMDTTVTFVRDFLYTRVCPTTVGTDLEVLLEGPYLGNGQMATELNPFIPTTNPYSLAPYNAPASTAPSIPADAVDWVLVEARTGTPNLTGPRTTQTIAQKAGFLLDDGSIVDVDGVSPLNFDLILGDEYHFAIRHRNHLDVLSNACISPLNPSLSYNFTDDVSQAFGTQQLKMINGKAVMFAGDITQDHTIQTTDYDTWFINKAKVGIQEMDY